MRAAATTTQLKRDEAPHLTRAAKILSVLFVTLSALALTYEPIRALPFTRVVPFTVSPVTRHKRYQVDAGCKTSRSST
jgi:hypothetical protein